MKIDNLYFLLFFLLFSASSEAQTATVQKGTGQGSKTNSSAGVTASNKMVSKTNEALAGSRQINRTSDSLKLAVTEFKTSMSTLFKPKRDTIAISIADIDYDNAELMLLKEGIKKLKGVKSLAMQYKSATALLEVAFKGKSMELWDALPPEAKKGFRLIEAEDNFINLAKNDFTGH